MPAGPLFVEIWRQITGSSSVNEAIKRTAILRFQTLKNQFPKTEFRVSSGSNQVFVSGPTFLNAKFKKFAFGLNRNTSTVLSTRTIAVVDALPRALPQRARSSLWMSKSMNPRRHQLSSRQVVSASTALQSFWCPHDPSRAITTANVWAGSHKAS